MSNDDAILSMTAKKDQRDQNLQQQKRKKATRACFHCQKAHLTCDDTRPCQRCIKRGLDATCRDGVRKKAKYLQDTYDSPPQKSTLSDEGDSRISTPLSGEIPLSNLSNNTVLDPNNPLMTLSLDSPYSFGSEAVNLEYSILSNMLSKPASLLSTGSNSPVNGRDNILQALALPDMRNDVHLSSIWEDRKNDDSSSNSLTSNSNIPSTSTRVQRNDLLDTTHIANGGNKNGDQFSAMVPANSPTPSHNDLGNSETDMTRFRIQNVGETGLIQSSTTPIITPGVGGSSKKSTSRPTVTFSGSSRGRYNPQITQENVYRSVTKPYAYTEGYHYLVKYAKEKMEKDDVLRIVRALAMFRPSFIALLMPLTEDDLTFIEKCFQRTLIEFEKLMSYSGTPTVVWRRTGEICVVGKEFSLLTQWSREQLLGERRYIYELMDNSSAVEYWEKFATHAFENTTQSVLTTCILLTPEKRPVPCAFCFTIKRDIFDVPLAIVGNFLPILS